MIGSLSLGLSWRDAVEHDSEAYLDERRVADLIVALTYEQQLLAYRYLQHPGPAYLHAFRTRGDEIYSEIHGFLFHALSMDARLGVEKIKESHQAFEVAATRAFERAQLGKIDDARLRERGFDDRAAALGSFGTGFDGTVAATNRERGARITIRLRTGEQMPERDESHTAVANTALLKRVHSTPTSTPAISSPTTFHSATGAPPLRVLIVDDEHAIREIQRRLLTRAGFDVVLASSGAAARDVMLREHVDLVVSDLRMPGSMDGYALLDWMSQERPALAQTALLATGDVSGAASVALPVPIDRILNKPFEGVEFVRRVRGALGIAPSGAPV
ncbi:hypothetical protein BH11GEM2_BH11GEM2_31350 [soil metagenome]